MKDKWNILRRRFEIIFVYNFSDAVVLKTGSNYPRNSVEIEKNLFDTARNKEEYLSFAARLIIHAPAISQSLRDKAHWHYIKKLLCFISNNNTNKTIFQFNSVSMYDMLMLLISSNRCRFSRITDADYNAIYTLIASH